MPTDPQIVDLEDEHRRLLSSVLDALIPPSEDGTLPGAGALGLDRLICQRAEDFLPVLRQAIDALQTRVAARKAGDFSALSATEQHALLEALAGEHPAFLPGLIFQTFSNYYQHPRVLVALGLEVGPPYPRGRDLEAGDLGLLEPVRQRGSVCREC